MDEASQLLLKIHQDMINLTTENTLLKRSIESKINLIKLLEEHCNRELKPQNSKSKCLTCFF